MCIFRYVKVVDLHVLRQKTGYLIAHSFLKLRGIMIIAFIIFVIIVIVRILSLFQIILIFTGYCILLKGIIMTMMTSQLVITFFIMTVFAIMLHSPWTNIFFIVKFRLILLLDGLIVIDMLMIEMKLVCLIL